MRRIVIVAILFAAAPAMAAFIDFDRVTIYSDNTAIPAAKIPTIQYRGYTGPAATGPWTAGNLVTDNVTITAPDPAPGATLWYTVDATLDGQTGAKGAAMSKSLPFQIPGAPAVRGVR